MNEWTRQYLSASTDSIQLVLNHKQFRYQWCMDSLTMFAYFWFAFARKAVDIWISAYQRYPISVVYTFANIPDVLFWINNNNTRRCMHSFINSTTSDEPQFWWMNAMACQRFGRWSLTTSIAHCENLIISVKCVSLSRLFCGWWF